MMWIGIVIMAIGFIGVCVFAKMKQQPPAAGSAVLMLIGLGIYMYLYLNPPPDRSGEYFSMAVAAKVAALPETKDAKAWIAHDVTGEYYTNIQEAYKNAGGQAAWVAVSEPDSGMFSMDKFKEELKKYTKDDVVIIDVSVTEYSSDLKKLLKDANCPKFFFTNNACTFMGFRASEVEKLLKDGKIVGIVAYQQNIDNKFKPSKSDLEEAFSKRYVIINKDNFKDNKVSLGLEESKK
ncbi:MAG: hypothetical protein E7058_03385 [Lentisphaerae bacterium]|nr:hypothetical protein [Lentisphaerota bacterium]